MKKLFLTMLVGGIGLTIAQAQTAPTNPTPATQTPTTTAPMTAVKPGAPSLNPQQVDVPEVVKSKFTASNGAVKNVTWRRLGNNYGAFYNENGKSSQVIYSATAEVMRSVKQIDASTMPKSITEYLNKNNAGQPVKAVTEIKQGNTPARYDVMVGDKRMAFDETGKLLTPQTVPAKVGGTPPAPTPAPTTAPATTTPQPK